MEKIYSYQLQKTVKRIDKKTARKLWNKGVSIYFHPSNMKFDNCWQQPFLTNKSSNKLSDDFDMVCHDYAYYNCDNFRGRYIHFFVAE